MSGPSATLPAPRPFEDPAARPARTRGIELGRLPVIAVLVALGLAVCCTADALSRSSHHATPWIFWAGVALIFAPVCLRLCSSEAAPRERLALVCMLGLALYLVKVMEDPFGFTFPDEFFHAFNADQIARTHGLFHSNPGLPVTSRFPGLEGATSALQSLTGMSSFGAGLLVIGAARVMLMAALFALFAALSRSAKIGGLATAAYAANSNFLLWSNQYSYESLALPLLVVVIAGVAKRETGRRAAANLWLAPLMLITAAVVVTHHLTSYLLAVMLVVIAAGSELAGRRQGTRSLWSLAAVAVVLSVGWLVVVASSTVGYVTPVINSAITQVFQTVSGESAPRTLFHGTAAAGPGSPFSERVVAIVAILLLAAALPFGLRAVWQRHRRQPLALLLCVFGVGFFGVLALRFAPKAWEVGNRLGEFAFIGVAFLVAFVPFVGPWRLAASARGRALVAFALTVIVVGGAIAGWPAATRLARPSRIVADGSQIESDPIFVGKWVGANLSGAVFAAPEAEARTILLYGRSKTYESPDLDLDNILSKTTFLSGDLAGLRRHGIRYVVIDLRPRAQDNSAGYYFSVHPPGGSADRLLPLGVASKFERLRAARVFDSGDVLVYDLGPALSPAQRSLLAASMCSPLLAVCPGPVGGQFVRRSSAPAPVPAIRARDTE
jgi:hypothetical protein